MAARDTTPTQANKTAQNALDQHAIAKETIANTAQLSLLNEPVEIARAIKLPFAELSVLGGVFASLSEGFRTITQTVAIPGDNLLRVTDQFGVPLNPSVLNQFRDGSGLIGSYGAGTSAFNQARFHIVGSQTASASTIVPMDPLTLAIAATLLMVNQKLDTIQNTQLEIFDYLKQQDKSKQRANLTMLTSILEGYRFNWDNTTWKTGHHNKALDVLQDAEQAINLHRSQIEKALVKKGLISDGKVRNSLETVTAELHEYQLALHLYALASFVEVVLLENFSPDYLDSVVTAIGQRSLAYRTLYTRCHDALERAARSTVQSTLLKGLSFAGQVVGDAVAKTPLGEKTQVDEALQSASHSLSDANSEKTARLVTQLVAAKDNPTLPFVQSINNINRLYNTSMQILTDGDALYLA